MLKQKDTLLILYIRTNHFTSGIDNFQGRSDLGPGGVDYWLKPLQAQCLGQVGGDRFRFDFQDETAGSRELLVLASKSVGFTMFFMLKSYSRSRIVHNI